MGSSQSTRTGTLPPQGQRAGLPATRFATLGAHLDAANQSLSTLRLAMANLQRQQGATFGGGAQGYFGGDEAADPAKGLREYEASLSAKAKEDVIRRLARALKRAGVSVDPEKDLDEIVKQLVAQLPNPRRGKTFAADAASQEKVCRVVADVLNDEFSPGATRAADKFIDTSLSTVEVCRAVGEWAHSFADGVNTEFLAVHASVRNILRTVEILDQIMAEIWAKIRGRVEDSSDPRLGRELDPLAEVYSRAQAERRRQEEVLKNILHVQLAPAAKELEIAMRDESEQNALVARLGLRPGTGEFADTLAMAISGLGTAASVAQRVNRALKQVGLSVREYLESPSFAEFEKVLDRKLESGAVKAEDLARFLEAMGTLRYGFDDRSEARFRAALEEAATGGASGAASGGAAEDERTPIERRVERREVEKTVILRDFAGRMSRHYDELLAAVKALGPELGKSVPLSDRTDALRDALARLRDMRAESERIEFALIGMYLDAAARERKERFLSALRLVSAACSAVMELDAYRGSSALFARLKAAIDSIEKTIDYFSDVIAKKYGGQEPPQDELAEGGAKHGGDDSVLPEVARSGLSLGEAVSEFAYFYYVAKVRANLDQTAKELDSYGEKYIDLLGDAVAARLYNLEVSRKAILDRLVDDAAHRAPVIAAAGASAPAAGPAQNVWWAALRRWVNDEYDTKAKFYRAVQAMDLYMKAFTVAIVSDPDAARDIKKMLDGTQVIARWFSDQTGEFIWRAFDQMGSTDFAGNVTAAAAGTAALANNVAADDHYYKKVAAAGAATLGIPQIGAVPSTNAEAARKSAGEALDHFQALKNLVNAFARIGDRFGGRELRTQVFMSPSQVYKALMDYMKQSALSINTAAIAPPAGGAAVPAAIALPAVGIPVANTIAAVATAVAPYQAFFGSVEATLAGNYAVEDRYFVLTIKAMAAKILTTLGVYDMLERTSPLYDLTPTRMIVGGADDFDSVPEVLEGAAELYFRLPRLAEFYRVFLRWDSPGAAGSFRIAMLPELEGVFAGFIRLIFQKVAAPESGDYSDSEMRALVREMNAIYAYYHEKQPDRATQSAISAFVMEVNRRYGVIKQEDIQKYSAMLKIARTGEYGKLNDTSYAILPGEDEAEVDRRAPSDRFALPGAAPANARPFAGRTELDTEWGAGGHRALLRDFRSRLEGEFARAANRDQFGKVSYALLIKQAEGEIRRASVRDAKFAVAAKLIQGTSVVGVDANKAYMFHETVVVGLNMLNAIEAVLRNFGDKVDGMDPRMIENAIMDTVYLDATGGAPVGHATKVALIAQIQALLPGLSPAAVAGVQRYLVDNATATYTGRAGVPMNATPTDVYTFLVAVAAANAATALPAAARPSSYDQADVTGAVGSAAQEQFVRALRTSSRLLTNYGLIMRDYIENLFDLVSTSQGLVEIRFASGLASGIQLNFAKLRSLAETLLSDVKHYFDLFRPFIARETVDRFESLSNQGSIFWLEKNLVDRYFRGADDDVNQAFTLDGLARRTSKVYENLLRKTHVQLGAIITSAGLTGGGAAAIAPVPADDDTRYENYGQALSEIVFYNAADDTSGQTGLAAAAGVLTANYDLGGLIRTSAATGAAGQVNTAAGAAAPALRYPLYQTAGGMTRYRSLLFAYNQLVARYLSAMTDTAGGQKTYLNLINAFANGVASQSVASPTGYSYPDLAANATVFGARGDPKPEAVLFQSLAFVLQRLVKDTNPTTQVPLHLVTTLTDVPLYMKESMRANLPGFVKLFELLMQKGDFVKQLLQKTGIRVGRPSQVTVTGATANVKIRRIAAGADDNDASNIYPANSLLALDPLDAGQTSDVMKAKLAGIIDGIASGAYTLSNAAAEVLRELGDSPVYLQTNEGSIETYRMRYGKAPLMPLSLALWYLGDLAPLAGAAGYFDDQRLFPRHTLGSSEFKLMYGTRQLLARTTPVGFEQAPGVKATLDAYNGVSAKREQIDEARYLRFVQASVTALRYLVEARNYKSMLTTSDDLFSTPTLIGGVNGLQAQVPAGAARGNTAYALAQSAQVVLTVVESSNQEDEASKIADRVGGPAAGAAGAGRDTERILNLIDMNIIPINVHGLMRDMPLANLYNYEFTFEQMIASLYGEQSAGYTAAAPINAVNTRHTRQMLLRLLVDPFAEVPLEMYGSDSLDSGSTGFVHRIFRGDNNLGMGRPKFLSDQVFNKALFGSIYQARSDYDEGGPAVGIGAARGQAVASGPVQNAHRELTAILAEIAVDRGRFLAAAGNAGGLAAAGAANRGAVYDLIFGANGLAANIRKWAAQLARLAAAVPAPHPQTAVVAISALMTPGAGAQNFGGLLAAIAGLGAGAGTRVAIIADANYDASVDALFLTEYNPATANSVPALITATLLPSTANSVAAALTTEIAAARRAPSGVAAANWRQGSDPRASKLAYLRSTAGADENAIVEVDVGAQTKARLEAIGKLRFDTRYIRKIFFIVNVVRLLRLKLNRELTRSRSVLIASHMTVAPSVTEYGADPFGPNEDLTSTLPSGLPRYNDNDAY